MTYDMQNHKGATLAGQLANQWEIYWIMYHVGPNTETWETPDSKICKELKALQIYTFSFY